MKLSRALAGKLLRVDLSLGSLLTEPLNMEWARRFIGGKGLAARYLYDMLEPGVDPFSERNVMIWMTGPLTGTVASTMSRVAVVTKSALTNTFLDSFAGGYFPAELKFADFDGIIITGKASKPVYLWIKDGQAELRDASQLWGKSTHEATDLILQEIGEIPKTPLEHAKIAVIGPAGEHLVRFANICFDKHHYAGRGGAGAIMGSKNLKAIAVRGTQGVRALEINRDKHFLELVREVIKKDIRENPNEKWAMTTGTPFVVDLSNDAGLLPTNNFQTGVFKDAEKINFDAMRDQILVKHTTTCFSCAIACRNETEVRGGKFKGLRGEGPEYETLGLAGSNCGIGDIRVIARFNDLCSQMGMDTMSAGNVAGWIMELYERGIVTREEVDGLDLKFGNEDAYLALPLAIAFRKGIGDLLAEGVMRAAKRIGRSSERYAVHAKGQEYPAYDPRGSIGMALAYATSDRGACHLPAWPVAQEAFGKLDPFTTQGKAELVVRDQIRTSLRWSLIACDFFGVDFPLMARLLSAVQDWAVTEEEARIIGRRIWNLTRMFNVREGFSRNEDEIPPRMTLDPLPDGTPKGKVVAKADFEKMLDEYYKIQGWDEQGRPTKETLVSLDLVDLIS